MDFKQSWGLPLEGRSSGSNKLWRLNSRNTNSVECSTKNCRVSMKKTIHIAKDFSRYPAGRYTTDGPHSGERFREEYLKPILERGERAVIELDGTRGYGSSFLEEAFGGLVRSGYSVTTVKSALEFHTSDSSLTDEIRDYIEHANDGT